jgi:hypothetical protein
MGDFVPILARAKCRVSYVVLCPYPVSTRELERCRDDVSDISELVEPLKLTASQYADVDPSKLWVRMPLETIRNESGQTEEVMLFL